jgi:REP element-mobilizing transposase RayT
LSYAAKDITLDSIRFHADKKYRLYAAVVMDTHAHVILQPTEQPVGAYPGLARIMHGIKSYSANQIQRKLNVTGKIWLDENYDRIIRDEEELAEKVAYIVNNPIKAGIVERPEDYKWLWFDVPG